MILRYAAVMGARGRGYGYWSDFGVQGATTPPRGSSIIQNTRVANRLPILPGINRSCSATKVPALLTPLPLDLRPTVALASSARYISPLPPRGVSPACRVPALPQSTRGMLSMANVQSPAHLTRLTDIIGMQSNTSRCYVSCTACCNHWGQSHQIRRYHVYYENRGQCG